MRKATVCQPLCVTLLIRLYYYYSKVLFPSSAALPPLWVAFTSRNKTKFANFISLHLS